MLGADTGEGIEERPPHATNSSETATNIPATHTRLHTGLLLIATRVMAGKHSQSRCRVQRAALVMTAPSSAAKSGSASPPENSTSSNGRAKDSGDEQDDRGRLRPG